MAQLVLGIDGGNSKVDIALAGRDGLLLGAKRGPTVSHQAVGLDEGMARLDRLIQELAAEVGAALPVEVAVASLAGADYPADVRLLERGLNRLGHARRVVVVNDTIGALRAGATAAWGVVLVCGQGINAAAIAPDGRQLRFAGVGDIAGDWGGGGGVGLSGLQAAIRGRDGRGPRTSLEKAVPAFFGMRSPDAVTRALYLGKVSVSRINELAPVVFRQADAGDAIARAIVTRLANELAGMANSLIRRLRLAKLPVEIVLAGGVFAADDEPFYQILFDSVHAVAPAATFKRLSCPPVAGAVLMAIDELGRRDPHALERKADDAVRVALATWDRRNSAR